MTILEIAERVQENTDNCEIVHTPPRPGDFPGKAISNERALEELGWKAETSFREGVRKYVEWVRGTTRPPDPIPGKQPSLNGNEHAAGALLAGAARASRSAPRGPRPHRRHRRGPRPAGADHQGRPRSGGSRRRGRDRQWPGGDGQALRRGHARWLQRHLPLDALAVRHPVLADHQVRADPLARPPPQLRFGGRGLLKLIEKHEPDVVISTYPGVTAVLGMLRENRRLLIPVQSAITDLAGLRYWAHPGVDLHFVTHPESIEEVERLAGPGSVEWTRPPISRDFLMPRTRMDARKALGVPVHDRLVLVSGGGWGIGDLEGAIESALAGDDTLSSASPAATRSPARSWSSASPTTSGCGSSASPSR